MVCCVWANVSVTELQRHLGSRMAFLNNGVLLDCKDIAHPYPLYPVWSARKCSLIPLRLPIQRKTSVSPIRIIFMNPPGIPSNMVIDLLIPDIIKDITEECEDRDAQVQKVQVFIGVRGFLPRFPES